MADDGFAWVPQWFRPRRPASNELLAHEWVTLESLWLARKRSAPALDVAESAAIDALFVAPEESNAAGWDALNKAEQRVGALLTPAQLKIEFGSLLQIATARGLATLAFHKGNEQLFDDAAKAEEARAAYLSLLYDLQSDFIGGRFRRKLRNEVAQRLMWYGIAALAIAIIVPLLLMASRIGPVDAKAMKPGTVMTLFSHNPVYGLAMVAGFGLLGAYFSRAMAFQANSAVPDTLTRTEARATETR